MDKNLDTSIIVENFFGFIAPEFYDWYFNLDDGVKGEWKKFKDSFLIHCSKLIFEKYNAAFTKYKDQSPLISKQEFIKLKVDQIATIIPNLQRSDIIKIAISFLKYEDYKILSTLNNNWDAIIYITGQMNIAEANNASEVEEDNEDKIKIKQLNEEIGKLKAEKDEFELANDDLMKENKGLKTKNQELCNMRDQLLDDKNVLIDTKHELSAQLSSTRSKYEKVVNEKSILIAEKASLVKDLELFRHKSVTTSIQTKS